MLLSKSEFMQLGAESEHHLPDVHTYPTPRLKISSVPCRTISFTLFMQLLWAWLSSAAAVRAFFLSFFFEPLSSLA